MRRRELLQNAAVAAGAVIASPIIASVGGSPITAGGSALLARLDDSGPAAQWRLWSECSSGCSSAGLHSIRIDSIVFPESLQRASIDAVFATVEGPRPFRIASLQRDSMSPLSKPFAFDADASALLGFQVEQHLPGQDRASVTAVSLLDARRQRLEPGRYLLAMSPDCGVPELSIIVRGLPVTRAVAASASVAVIGFSVLPPKIV